MSKESRTQVESIYKTKEEKVLVEAFQLKIARLICQKPSEIGMKCTLKN